MKPSVGKSLYLKANCDRLWTTLANFRRTRSSASRMKIKSALSVTWDMLDYILQSVID